MLASVDPGIRCLALALAISAAACTGEITSGGGRGPGLGEDDGDGTADGEGDGDDTGDGSAEMRIVSPAPGTTFQRDSVGAAGYLVAAVTVELEIEGDVAEVGYRVDDGPEQGRLAATDGSLAAEVLGDGAATITVVAYDTAGASAAAASVEVTVEAPQPADCHGWLDLYGMPYEIGPTREGVADPVTLTTPINGLAHRYVENAEPRTSFFMDCELALALLAAAPILRERGVVEVADIGVYNYRCIGGGTPPDCPGGISQHAFARGIDIAGYQTADGTFYSVNDDWVIDADGDETCAAGTDGARDSFLHEAICAQKAAGIWNIVLTPNYNADHRNHFHVDLTDGSDFIEHAHEPPGTGAAVPVDVGPDRH